MLVGSLAHLVTCLYPHRYHEAYEYYKKAQASYWTVEEVDLSQDMRDWERLTDSERHFISYVLAFFAASDGIVIENLAVRFMQGEELPPGNMPGVHVAGNRFLSPAALRRAASMYAPSSVP